MRRRGTLVAVAAIVAVGLVGPEGLAQPEPEPLAIVTGGATYDPTILTKFVPGIAFWPGLGGPVNHVDSGCVSPPLNSAMGLAAPVELPRGARITRLISFGSNTTWPEVTVSLYRVTETVSSFGSSQPTRSVQSIAWTTSPTPASGEFMASTDVSPPEVVGSFATSPTTSQHRFHTLRTLLTTSAQVLCGVQIEYQVPMAAASPGATFHAITPVRVFDSRQAAYPQSGALAPNTSKTISVADGRNLDGVVTAPNVVPVGATAITYNITVARPTGANFVAVTPGGASGYSTSAINFGANDNLANAGTVAVDAQRRITLWGGTGAATTNVVIDVTGYYAPPVPFPNMGN